MTPQEAKARSEAVLREKGIPINETLPVIEAPSELSPQDAQSVAQRCIVLSYVIGLGFGQTGAKMKATLEKWGLYDLTSDSEKQLLSATTITDQDRIKATWLTECVQSLAYCLGLVSLDHFRQCDDDLASHFPRDDPAKFIEMAKLRPFDDVYQQADLLYRLHWAARDCRLRKLKCRVQEGLIEERRKAIDWVMGVADDWDNIPLDT